jgi:hypothetical protein
VAGNATKPATIPEVPDWQVTPPDGTVAYTVTDLVPGIAPLTVNVPLSAPLAAPAVPLHEYVAPAPLPEAVNTTSVPRQTMQQTLLSFENYLLANRKTEKPILHISLNPSPEDKLSDKQFAFLAKDYMEKMGYGAQPYIVYKHEDLERRHIHVVSVCTDENGVKIPDSFEWKRSMDACRELELKYGLSPIADRKKEADTPYLKKVNYDNGDVKTQIANVLKSVASAYKYQSFGEYNALLSCFNIEAKQVNGEYDGKPYKGIIYAAVNDKGIVSGLPFKSSLFGKTHGFEALEKRMKRSSDNFKKGKFSPMFKNDVIRAIHYSKGNRNNFVEQLKKGGIDTVFRENEENRIYGITFIDHNRKEVFNGSRLGKEFSANVFNRRFNEPSEPRLDKPTDTAMPEKDSLTSQGNIFSSAPDKETALGQLFGLFDMEGNGQEWEEEAFIRQLKKKKKKQRKL